MEKNFAPILVVNLLISGLFGYFYLSDSSYDLVVWFLGPGLLLMLIVGWTIEKFPYSKTTLWGLTLWNFVYASSGVIDSSQEWVQIAFLVILTISVALDMI